MQAAIHKKQSGGDVLKWLAWTGTCVLLAVAFSACGSLESREKAGYGQSDPTPAAESAAASNIETADAQPVEDEPGKFSRNANLTAGLVGSMVKTYTTDPFVRPVSTAKSLGFLIKNSVTDLTRRAYVNAVGMPRVKQKPIPEISSGPGMNLDEWERELDRIADSKSTYGTLEFLVDGEEFFPALIEELEGAKRSIQMRTYIFDNDDFAVQMADLLKKRSRQVEVTVLMDGIGTITGAHATPASMPESHQPPPSIVDYLEEDSKVEARSLNNPWFTGDHCKVAIIDRRVAFLGGMNIGREYRFDWHDLMVRVEGAVVEELARDADRAWEESGPLGDFVHLFRQPTYSESQEISSGYPVRVLYTQTDNSQIYRAKIAAIRRAQQYIYIENPYFSDDVILYELIKARKRGVDVRFIISSGGDHPLMDKSNARALNDMLENGIRVYLYPRMTHAKAAIIDGWLTVGSANLDHLSLRVNNEVNVATSHPQAVQALKEKLFERDFKVSVELTEPMPTELAHWLAEIWADMFM